MAFTYLVLYLRDRIALGALAEHMRLRQERNRISYDEADTQKQEAADNDEKVQNCEQQHLTVVVLTCLKAILHGVTNAIAVGGEPLHQLEERLNKETDNPKYAHDAHDA